MVRFGPLRRRTELRMQMGGSFPDTIVATLRLQSASLPRANKSLALASVQETRGTAAAARQMGGFCGSTGYLSRQDALAATDMGKKDKNASGDDDFEAMGAREISRRGKPNGLNPEQDTGTDVIRATVNAA